MTPVEYASVALWKDYLFFKFPAKPKQTLVEFRTKYLFSSIALTKHVYEAILLICPTP